MYDPNDLLSPDPDPTWVTHVSAESVGTAVSHLLEAAVERLCWLDEEVGDPILDVLKLAKSLASILAKDAASRGALPVPVRVAVLAARSIDDGAARLEGGVLVDPFGGDFIEGGRHLLTNMRHTAGELRNAAGAL